MRFSTTKDGTHGSGTEYTAGVTYVGTPGQSGAYTQIITGNSSMTLYVYCSAHNGMGSKCNIQDDLIVNNISIHDISYNFNVQ